MFTLLVYTLGVNSKAVNSSEQHIIVSAGRSALVEDYRKGTSLRITLIRKHTIPPVLYSTTMAKVDHTTDPQLSGPNLSRFLVNWDMQQSCSHGNGCSIKVVTVLLE